jgi:hypothetical protein
MVYVLLDINGDWFYPINGGRKDNVNVAKTPKVVQRGKPERKWRLWQTEEGK